MTGDPFQLPSRGQPVEFSASTHEMILRGARKSLESRATKADSARSRQQKVVTAIVRNTSGEDLPEYCPIGLGECIPVTESIEDPAIGTVFFESADPSTSAPWGITQQFIADGDIGVVMLEGPTWVIAQEVSDSQRFCTFDGTARRMKGVAAGRFFMGGGLTIGSTSKYVPGLLMPQSVAVPCANLFYVEALVGDITGSFDWILRDNTDGGATVASGTYTLGSTSTSSLKTAIEAGTGVVSINSVTGGVMPANDLTIRPNEGLEFTKYTFEIVAWDLTPQAGGDYALIKVRDCCVVGG